MITIDRSSSKPYYEQVVFAIKEEILQGILRSGDKIPSIRELAQQLLMNPNTISKAYKQLESENVILTVRGKGTFIKAPDLSVRNEQQIKKVKQQFTDLVIEARYLNVEFDELENWLKNTKKSLEV